MTTFGVQTQRLLIFIRSDKPVEMEEDDEVDFNIDEINEIRESLQKNVAHIVNLVGPYKFYVDFADKDTMRKAYDAATNYSKRHQQNEEHGNADNFAIEGVGNILAEMEDESLGGLQDLDD